MKLPNQAPTSNFLRRVPTSGVGYVFGAFSLFFTAANADHTYVAAASGQTGRAVVSGLLTVGMAALTAYNFGIRPRGRSLR